jgi:hypothetical protein
VPEAEYLIRPSSHDGWLTIPSVSLTEVLTPRGYDTRLGEGWGDVHLQAAGYEISFAFEDIGWQVTFDGDITGVETDELVAQVARQIQNSTGTATEWIRIT